MKETRFLFYVLWQAPCARIAIGKDISVAAKCERRRHREMRLGKGRNFTASFEVKF